LSFYFVLALDHLSAFFGQLRDRVEVAVQLDVVVAAKRHDASEGQKTRAKRRTSLLNSAIIIAAGHRAIVLFPLGSIRNEV
jgi:hypothetical protein